MNSLIRKAVSSLRSAFTLDAAATAHLEKTNVDVTLRSRLWGV
ncbi:MAG: hypothetical protein U1E15_02485 [Hyphomicrobiales bacterium]